MATSSYLKNLNKANLISIPTLVEAPFVYITIGGFTFGLPGKTYYDNGMPLSIDFPNYVQSLEVTKMNGEYNTYLLSLIYVIRPGDDPNKIDNILSSIANDRKIIISYGDWCSPGNIFKEEEALITNVTTSVNLGSSGSLGTSISYSISAISNSLKLSSYIKSYAGSKQLAVGGTNRVKPSTIILDLIRNKDSGIANCFKGMSNYQSVLNNGLIATDDKAVELQAKTNMNTYDYLLYLVLSMVPEDSTSTICDSFYTLTVVDDNKDIMNGSYFKVTRVRKNTRLNQSAGSANYTVSSSGTSINTSSNVNDSYQLDIGYPGDNFISDFRLSSTDTWSILYENNVSNTIEQISYKYDKYGNLILELSPTITRAKSTLTTTSQDKLWWTKMTEFPIKATITFKGLVRPTMLVLYVKINCVFFGRKHSASGTYIITSQKDNISTSGYRTTLELLRVGGE